jgi:hypothetical protein
MKTPFLMPINHFICRQKASKQPKSYDHLQKAGLELALE